MFLKPDAWPHSKEDNPTNATLFRALCVPIRRCVPQSKLVRAAPQMGTLRCMQATTCMSHMTEKSGIRERISKTGETEQEKLRGKSST